VAKAKISLWDAKAAAGAKGQALKAS
jgi:hypothetical protein